MSSIRERLPWTLQIGAFIFFFNGCVCTLGPPALPTLEEMEHGVLEPTEAWRTPSYPSARVLAVCLLSWEFNDAQGGSLTSAKGVTCAKSSALNLRLLPTPTSETCDLCTLARKRTRRVCSKERNLLESADPEVRELEL